jgi:hypothetical protein
VHQPPQAGNVVIEHDDRYALDAFLHPTDDGLKSERLTPQIRLCATRRRNERQPPLPVVYKGVALGHALAADLIVESCWVI